MTARVRRRLSYRKGVGMVATAAAVVALSLAGASGANAADRVPFNGSIPSWANHANDAGAAPASTTVEGELYFPLRNASAATALATAVSSPLSPSYRKTLSPAAWIAAFAPTQATVNAAAAYLKAQGLTITAIPASREYIVYRGTPAQLNATFATSMHVYAYAGERLIAPSTVPSLPSAIGNLASGVSLDQGNLLTRPDHVVRPDSGGTTTTPAPAPNAETPKTAAPNTLTPNTAAPTAPAAPTPPVAAPCSTYIGQYTATVPAAYGKTVYPTDNCGYTPAQLRSAYSLTALSKSGVSGAGQTVAVIDAYASPTILKDVDKYSASVGEPGITSATYQQIVPPVKSFSDDALCNGTDPSGWQTEQSLDVESIHGVAPAAKVLYVGGFNCGGGIDIALSKILDSKLANIVSNSYSEGTEALDANYLQGQENLHIQAVGEGIGLYFSSGDDGDDDAINGTAGPEYEATSPWVTGVGGTALGVAKNGTASFEVGWGDDLDQIVAGAHGKLSYVEPLPGDFYAGAGGGTSILFPQPAYQKGIVPAALARGQRVAPDLGAIADPFTGYLIGLSPLVNASTQATGQFEEFPIGGTSLSTPVMAAMIALVQQQTHTSIGFANPTLYGLYRILPSAFRDITPSPTPLALVTDGQTSSYLLTLDKDSTLSTSKGYDDVTGLGGISFQLLTLLAQGRH